MGAACTTIPERISCLVGVVLFACFCSTILVVWIGGVGVVVGTEDDDETVETALVFEGDCCCCCCC